MVSTSTYPAESYTIQILKEDSTESPSFYLEKKISYGDLILSFILLLIFSFLISKFIYNFSSPEDINYFR